MLNSEFLKYGVANLDGISAIHLDGDFDSVVKLLQGQVTSDCLLVSNSLGQPSSLCDEKGFILCNFDIIFSLDKWLIIINESSKDIFLNEIAKFLPFYKVACVIIDAEIFGISRKKDSHSMPDECVIIENEQLLLSIIVNLGPKHDLDTINLVNWSINRKIMGDHLINIENQGQFRPHELGQDKNRVSFSKGCFRGQEIIARMEYLGKAKKETRLIIHVGEKEISKFTVIGETHEYQGKYFSSCLGKKEQFFD